MKIHRTQSRTLCTLLFVADFDGSPLKVHPLPVTKRITDLTKF